MRLANVRYEVVDTATRTLFMGATSICAARAKCPLPVPLATFNASVCYVRNTSIGGVEWLATNARSRPILAFGPRAPSVELAPSRRGTDPSGAWGPILRKPLRDAPGRAAGRTQEAERQKTQQYVIHDCSCARLPENKAACPIVPRRPHRPLGPHFLRGGKESSPRLTTRPRPAARFASPACSLPVPT